MPTDIETLTKPGEVGFLNADGSSKSRAQESAAQSKLNQNPKSEPASTTDFSKEKVDGAFDNISQKSLSSVNSIGSELNIKGNFLKDEAKDIRAQKEIAKELKEELKKSERERDQEKVRELQTEFNKI